MKPRILISRSESNSAENYVAAFYGVGCIADSIYAPSISTGYDALVLAGGDDIDPTLYGEENQGSQGIDRVRDDADLLLCESFIKQGKPILGICRGHQVLNVYFGGTLYQHIEGHRVDGEDMLHDTVTEEGSLMSRLFGKNPIVNSIHHQSVDLLGEGLLVTQRSNDGTVEAFEHKILPIIGVQWHPERLCLSNKRDGAADSIKLFEYFASQLK